MSFRFSHDSRFNHYFLFHCILFFFQAEDGIRYFCLSRGLGDVYKRQGEKTALSLIGQFHDIDAIYAQLDTLEIKPGVRKKLGEGKEMAYTSRKLGEICLLYTSDAADE